MNEDEVLAVLQNVGAFRSGHFVFTSGLHADTYIIKDAIYPYTRETSKLCRAMAERFVNDNVQAVIGPAIGAAILSQWTAHHLTALYGKDVLSTYADKDGNGGFVIKRGYDVLLKGKRTLVVEDNVTTGGSLRKVIEAARMIGADVVGAVAICNRGEVPKEAIANPPRFESLVNIHLEQWPEKECVLCEKGIPVNIDVGHGREFLAHKQA